LTPDSRRRERISTTYRVRQPGTNADTTTDLDFAERAERAKL
jgi:hypothetical protein